MGDAGPPLPTLSDDNIPAQREVTVLVTGFGPFRTFTHNPSHLITTQLAPILLPNSSPTKLQSQPETIIRILLPPTLRVSYPTITTTLPTLLTTLQPDYILHLGMAAGRRHYALETLAHRDGYTIKDVDAVDGLATGSQRWLAEGCPKVLEVGWDGRDVLARWRGLLDAGGGAGPEVSGVGVVGGNEIPDVRLSTDAGRFLCDFVFYESLSLRWKDARRRRRNQPLYSDPTAEISVPAGMQDELDVHGSREGKAAFLHVPGDTDQAAIERGVRVTEAAIRALVGSWEAGCRRKRVEVGFVS